MKKTSFFVALLAGAFVFAVAHSRPVQAQTYDYSYQAYQYYQYPQQQYQYYPWYPPYDYHGYRRNQLSVSCYPNVSYVYEGDSVTWTARASGGEGGYRYRFRGDEISNSNSRSDNDIRISYDEPGTKQVSVTVTSDGRSVTQSCGTVYVIGRRNYPPYPYYPYPSYPTYPTYPTYPSYPSYPTYPQYPYYY